MNNIFRDKHDFEVIFSFSCLFNEITMLPHASLIENRCEARDSINKIFRDKHNFEVIFYFLI